MLETLGPDLLLMSAVGVASLLIFRGTASKLINLVASEEDETTEASIDRIAIKIAQESKQLSGMRGSYQTRIDFDAALDEVSPTLTALLSRISDKLHRTLPGALIGNMVTNVITNRATTLQTALGALVSRKTLFTIQYNTILYNTILFILECILVYTSS